MRGLLSGQLKVGKRQNILNASLVDVQREKSFVKRVLNARIEWVRSSWRNMLSPVQKLLFGLTGVNVVIVFVVLQRAPAQEPPSTRGARKLPSSREFLGLGGASGILREPILTDRLSGAADGAPEREGQEVSPKEAALEVVPVDAEDGTTAAGKASGGPGRTGAAQGEEGVLPPQEAQEGVAGASKRAKQPSSTSSGPVEEDNFLSPPEQNIPDTQATGSSAPIPEIPTPEELEEFFTPEDVIVRTEGCPASFDFLFPTRTAALPAATKLTREQAAENDYVSQDVAAAKTHCSYFGPLWQDVPGTGDLGARDVATSDACAAACDALPTCASFEWSPASVTFHRALAAGKDAAAAAAAAGGVHYEALACQLNSGVGKPVDAVYKDYKLYVRKSSAAQARRADRDSGGGGGGGGGVKTEGTKTPPRGLPGTREDQTPLLLRSRVLPADWAKTGVLGRLSLFVRGRSFAGLDARGFTSAGEEGDTSSSGAKITAGTTKTAYNAFLDPPLGYDANSREEAEELRMKTLAQFPMRLSQWLAEELPKIPILHMDPLDFVLNHEVVDPQLPLWLEFGVFQGRTANQVAAYAAGVYEGRPRVVGFDSFQGLPENWAIGSAGNVFFERLFD